MTTIKSLKFQALLNEKEQNASLVIGFSEEEFVTFQAKGMTKIVSDKIENHAWDTYSSKFIGKDVSRKKENIILLQFIPSWWRYTDLKTKPWTKFSSG